MALINDLLARHPNARIIAISGGMDPELHRGFLETAAGRGALRTLPKPCTSEQLLDAIRTVPAQDPS